MNRGAAVLLVLTPAVFLAGASEPTGPEAAREQYRVARRLAAEGAPGAADALRKVVPLDPTGPLADDALLDLAFLLVPAEWPEDLGRTPPAVREEARGLLERAASVPGADRLAEARYRRSLLALDPAPGRDADAVRQALLRIAARPESGIWGDRARYAAAWIDAHAGEAVRARGGFTRIVLDAPTGAAAVRARIGLGLLDLREGHPGRAAVRFHEAVSSEPSRGLFAGLLRRAAIRDLDRRGDAARGWGASPARALLTDTRAVSALARSADGSLFVADRKAGLVRRFDLEGREIERWTLDEPTAIAIDPYGRSFVSAGERLYRLEGPSARPVASLGRFAPASSLAVDPTGRVFVLDRRGDRIGVVPPEGEVAVALREERGTRLAGLAWDGRRLLGADARAGRLLEIGSGGAERVLLAAAPFDSAAAIAIDPGGGILVADAKSGDVILLDAAGSVRDRVIPRSPGPGKPSLVSAGPEGSLDLWDDATGTVWRIP